MRALELRTMPFEGYLPVKPKSKQISPTMLQYDRRFNTTDPIYESILLNDQNNDQNHFHRHGVLRLRTDYIQSDHMPSPYDASWRLSAH